MGRQIKKELVKFTRYLAEKELISGSEGNLSVRTENGFWITPSGKIKELITEKELCFVNNKGEFLKGRPSSEWGMHFLIYRKNPHVKAVVHTHPTYALSLDAMGFSFRDFSLKEAKLLLGEVGVLSYFEPGSPALWEFASNLAKSYRVIFLKGHGLLTMGSSLEEAVNLTLIFEKLCKVEWLKTIKRG